MEWQVPRLHARLLERRSRARSASWPFGSPGSSDLFDDGRRPYHSINFITAHDGFTLFDSVAYNEKHNEANGENNQDGHNDNRSWNCGDEGPTDDPDVNALRRRQLRNFLTTLILSQGVPMLLGGDEFGRTQNGNNNAYCQDNEISWFHWELAEWQKRSARVYHAADQLRREHPVFRRPKFFQGRRIRGAGVKDVMWLDVDGTEMTEENWNSGFALCLGMMVSGDTMDVRDVHGEAVKDDTFLLLFNAFHEPMTFVLAGKQDVSWQVVIDTEAESGFLEDGPTHSSNDELELCPRSMCVLRLVKGTQEEAYSVAWKQQQKAAPSAPPTPHHPQRTFRDATTVTKTTAEPAKKGGGAPREGTPPAQARAEAPAGEEGVARPLRGPRAVHLHHPSAGVRSRARRARWMSLIRPAKRAPRRLGLRLCARLPSALFDEQPQDRCSSARQISPISPGPS